MFILSRPSRIVYANKIRNNSFRGRNTKERQQKFSRMRKGENYAVGHETQSVCLSGGWTLSIGACLIWFVENKSFINSIFFWVAFLNFLLCFYMKYNGSKINSINL